MLMFAKYSRQQESGYKGVQREKQHAYVRYIIMCARACHCEFIRATEWPAPV